MVTLVALLVAMVMVILDPRRSPEVSRGLGPLVVGVMLVLHLAFGGLLYWLAQKGWVTALAVLTVLAAVPVLVPAARLSVLTFSSWRFEREAARIGDFRDPALRPMAEAVRAGDCTRLAQLLAAQGLPAGHDRAGNDLLAFVLGEVRDRKGDMACLRVLLEAGVDPRVSRTAEGQDPLNFMIVDITPTGREVVLLLLRHGADPNVVDPITGFTPIREAGHDPALVRALVEAGAEIDRVQPDGLTALVHFVASQACESAAYLVEQGADLDVSHDGVSLAYYEASWNASGLGVPEGWQQVKRAIAARRAAAPDTAGGQ